MRWTPLTKRERNKRQKDNALLLAERGQEIRDITVHALTHHESIPPTSAMMHVDEVLGMVYEKIWRFYDPKKAKLTTFVWLVVKQQLPKLVAKRLQREAREEPFFHRNTDGDEYLTNDGDSNSILEAEASVMLTEMLPLLTPIQREVLLRVLAGWDKTSIGREYGYSKQAIDYHMKQIQEKLSAFR